MQSTTALSPHNLLITAHCGQAPSADEAGIGIGDVGALNDRREHPVEGMMDHTVPEGRGPDQAFFRIVDPEGPVATPLENPEF